jgi:hypothetical protein
MPRASVTIGAISRAAAAIIAAEARKSRLESRLGFNGFILRGTIARRSSSTRACHLPFIAGAAHVSSGPAIPRAASRRVERLQWDGIVAWEPPGGGDREERQMADAKTLDFGGAR